MSLADHILAAVANATPQAPWRDSEIYAAIRGKHRIETGEFAAALETMTAQRLLNTARITRNDITHCVYWPTGLRTPALAGIQPKEPLIVPHTEEKPDTLAQKLIKAIVLNGPIANADLADKTGCAAKSIDSLLRTAIKSGQVTTRPIYVAEAGRELRHWMTSTQAQEWDERSTGGSSCAAADDPATEPPAGDTQDRLSRLEDVAVALAAERDGLLGLIGARDHPEAIDMLDAVRAEMHRLKNDVAAYALILSSLSERLQVARHEDVPGALDELLHALATRAATAQGSAGRLALLLVDSADLTEIEELPAGLSDQDAESAARAAVLQGHAARAVVVRIQGEARLQVEWKEAA